MAKKNRTAGFANQHNTLQKSGPQILKEPLISDDPLLTR